MSIITIERKILEKNDTIAEFNRNKFKEKKIFVANLLSSPGSGKTSILEKVIETLKDKINIAVIEGDIQTELDAERIEKYEIPVAQIITNGACHLEANLIRDAFNQIEENNIELLFIENVGNLVCPAGFDLGENIKIVIVSTTEGDDKPLKYPTAFRKASALIINKVDLIPYLNSSIETLKSNALKINPQLKIFETSCTTGSGIYNLCEWLENYIYKSEGTL